MRSKPRLSSEEREELARAEGDCDRIVEQLERLRERERRTTAPVVASTGGIGSAIEFAHIARAVVPPGALLLMYHVGADAGFVFVVHPRKGSVDLHELVVPPEAASLLGASSGPLTRERLSQILTGYDRTGKETGLGIARQLGEPIPLGAGSKIGGTALQRLETRLYALFRLLVPQEIWRTVREVDEVIIVPDGPLLSLPFEVLVLDDRGDGDAISWLDNGPVIRYAPSIAALHAIDRRHGSTPRRELASVLSVCNPLYGTVEAGPSSGTTAAWVSRRAFDARGGSLVPLPGTERETARVVEAFGIDNVEVLHGASATESAVREAMREKSIVHLATHGLVSARRNDLLAALALTPARQSLVESRDDGFMQLFEINALDLSAELVVLSACESSFGRYIPGEGVMALSRGFHAAGASRVVASLWKVDDAATAELVAEFMSRVASARGRGGDVDVARALRDAKRSVRHRTEWSQPFYWGAFVLTGIR